MRKLLIVLAGLIFCAVGFSQSDSVQKNKYKFIASFDMRNSVLIGHAVKFNGVKFGFGSTKNRFGIGFYGLRRSVLTINNKVDSVDATDTNRYQYGYLSLYYERILYQSKRWECTAPIHFNVGSLKGKYLTTQGKYKQFLDRPVTSLTLSIKGHYKILRWIGLHGGLGYNFLLGEDERTSEAINAPFYSFGVKLFLGELWKITTSKSYRKSEWID